MHILIAPNAFKNSLNAREVAMAVQKGLGRSKLSCTTECFPVGDGGDGTAQLITEKFNGQRIGIKLRDPLGRKITASFGLIDEGKTAVIEMADASGIRLLEAKELNPAQATSLGTGDMMLAALDKGVSKIIVGVGGSATVDGGVGMLAALGVKFLDSGGFALNPVPAELSRLAAIDMSGIDQRIYGCNIVVLCDVNNYLLGTEGSVAVFGPQKGVKASEVRELDKILLNISNLASVVTGKQMDQVKHGGAAGGIAAALYAFCNAELVSGAEYFLNLTSFDTSLDHCNLVITGEGSLDEQTLQGKAPFAVSVKAKKLSIPVIGIAGRVPLESDKLLGKYFDVLQSIGHEPSDLSSAIGKTEANLIRTGILIGNLISISENK